LHCPLIFADWQEQLVAAALERTKHNVTYDGRYITIPYPNGDVPANIGVCTDVVVRAYRQLGVDLQQLVHEDMSAAFSQYPNFWSLDEPDSNIDHRRVPNLQTFFKRHDVALEVTDDPSDYKPGDIVSWLLGGRLPHIGIVVADQAPNGNPLIVHNIGAGPQKEDFLFGAKITGHYRFIPINTTY
jgi:uncharacterized protein YijF (DUF1287 family)